MTELRDAVVVGGGLAGLTAAHVLAEGGLRPLVLESADRVGGLVRHGRVGGVDVDLGAESFGLRRPEVAALAGRLGLHVESPAAPSTLWVPGPDGAGRVLTVPARSLLGIPADPFAADVVAVVGTDAARRAAADRDLDRAVGADATSLADLVGQRMGAELLERLVRPVARGIHAIEPEELAVDAVAPGLRAALGEHGSLGRAVAALVPEGPAVACVAGGMWRLPAALAAAGPEVRTRSRATALSRDDGGAWTMHVADDGGAVRCVRTPRVIVATPGPAALDLLSGPLPGPVPQLRPGSPIVHVTLVVRAPELAGAPVGSGVLVAPGAHGVRAKALTHASAKWAWLARSTPPGTHVLRLSYGRPDDPDGALDDVDAEVARRDAEVLLGVRLAPERVLDSRRLHRPHGVPPTAAADPATRALVSRAHARGGLAVCGAWVAGTGIAAVVPQAREEAARLLAE